MFELKANLYTDAQTLAFIAFAHEFAAEASGLVLGLYQSDNEQFSLVLLATIDKWTPARINRETGLIQIDKSQFDNFSFEMRFFILLHEWFHYKLQSKSEFVSDLEALRLYLALGLDAQEAVNSMTKVFKSKSPKNKARIKNIQNYILFFNQ